MANSPQSRVGASSPTEVRRRAAQYVRRSTNHQRYSIEGQKECLGQYAVLHDLEIVRTYCDDGKSGVHLRRRVALQQLLHDIRNGAADFEVILVYDVTRWGRFQDADEAAYYEFLCKSAGISVVYCAEMFENDGSAMMTLMKVIKRIMAGEYSRELSVKTAKSHRYYAEQGFHQGGSRNFGLHRQLVDSRRNPKAILRDGEQKNIKLDRVVLVPGPESERKVIERIFYMFAVLRMSQREIARTLNEEGVRNGRGNRWSWSNMSKTLANEKYGGTFTYGVSRWPLSGGRIPVPKHKWVRVEGAIPTVVNPTVFAAAQRRLSENAPLTEWDMLNYLTAVWCTAGALSIPIVNRDRFAPAAPTYREHFGHITDAYRRVGYKQVHCYRYSKISGEMRRVHRNVICQLTGDKNSRVAFEERTGLLIVDEDIRVSVAVLPFLRRAYIRKCGWKLYLGRLPACHAIFIVRMNEANSEILDYHLVPRSMFDKPVVLFTADRIASISEFAVQSATEFGRVSTMLARAVARS